MFLLAGSLLVAWVSAKRQRVLRKIGKENSVHAKFLGYVFEWSISLAIVLSFYYSLIFLIESGWESVTVATLLQMESFFSSAQRFVEQYRPTWMMWMAVLIVAYALSRVWIRFLDRDTPFRAFKRFKTILRYTTTIVFLLSSFTLLGFDPGDAAATFEIHLQQIRTDYGVVRAQLKQALEGVAVTRVYGRVIDAYLNGGAVSRLVNDSGSSTTALRQAYDDAQTNRGVHDDDIERILRDAESRESQVKRAVAAVGSGPATSADADVPSSLTHEQLTRARSSVQSLIDRVKPQFLHLVDQPGGREIVLAMPEGPLDRLSVVLDPIAAAYPVFGPVFDVLKSTLNDAFEAAIDRKLDELTATALSDPDALESSLNQAAADVGGAPQITTQSEKSDALNREVDRLQGDVSRLDGAVQQLTAPPTPAEEAEAPSPTPGQSESDGAVGDVGSQDGTPGLGQDNAIGSCTCVETRDGVPVNSFQIPAGASCGSEICRPGN